MADIFPPRPQGKMNPSDLPYYEQQGIWLVQRKFNDTRNLLNVQPGKKVRCISRHKEAHKRFSLNRALETEILDALKLDPNKEYWIDGGIMNKHKGGEGQLVFWDVLQAGRYFFASPSLVERYQILADICGNPKEREPTGIALQISPNLWLAENFFDHFEDRFVEALGDDRIEGLVLKKANSTLDNFGKVYYEVGWQIRCRKPHKNYNI
jgi:ATP-dependent DNA ligase